MKRIGILAVALSLTACAAVAGATQIISAIQTVAAVAGRPASTEQTAAVATVPHGTVGDAVVMRGTQALLVAHNAYQTAASVAQAWVASGQATPAQLNRIEQLNDRALSLLETGGRGLTIAQRAAEVMNIVAELNLFGRR